MRSRKWLPAAVALGFSLGIAAVARADLDVGIPPGTPVDWVTELPRKTPTGSVKVPTGPGGDAPEPAAAGKRAAAEGTTGTRTTTVERPADIVPSDIGLQSAMVYARVATFDIGFHIGWVNKRPPLELDGTAGPVKTGNFKFGPEVAAEYPPPVSHDLFWITGAVLLRKLIHPELVPNAESINFLILVGEPSLVSCTAAEGETLTKPWVEAVRAEVKGIPEERPRAFLGKDVEESMLLRLTAEDLCSGYPTGFDADFASHILALEPYETAPLLVKYLDPNAAGFLRRNAAGLLANYTGESVNAALVKTLANERDGVVRARIADALVRRHETGAIPWLEQQAAKPGLLRAIAIFGLGTIGEPKSSKTLLKFLEEREDPDILGCVVPATARMKHEKPKDATLALKKLAKFLVEAEEGTFKETPKYNSTTQGGEEAMQRVSILLEMTVIAMARLGDEPAKKWLEQVLDGEPVREVPRGRKRPGSCQTYASSGTFGSLHSPSFPLLLESLPFMGDTGRKRLEVVAMDTVCEVPLRIMALEGLAQMKALGAESLEKVLEEPRPLLRAKALKLLAALDEAKGFAAATRVLEKYDEDTEKNGGGADVVVSARLLSGKGAKPPVPLLLKCLPVARAAAAAFRAKGPQKDPVLGDMTIHVRPPVLEEILKALGASAEDAAAKPLLEVAQDRDCPARASAVAALGGFDKARPALVAFLDDEDGWVRYVAYRVLKRRAPPTFVATCDWIYGNKTDRADPIKRWKEWAMDSVSRDAERKTDDVVDSAIAAYLAKEKDAAAWTKAKADLRAAGLAGLKRLLEVSGDPKKSAAGFACLRAATGEMIPDDYEAWKGYLDSLKK
ncbi:HEAT repeat domain-containing protein [bacterium]|nr:HEAT repeat domain-containing protein [bacterium]